MPFKIFLMVSKTSLKIYRLSLVFCYFTQDVSTCRFLYTCLVLDFICLFLSLFLFCFFPLFKSIGKFLVIFCKIFPFPYHLLLIWLYTHPFSKFITSIMSLKQTVSQNSNKWSALVSSVVSADSCLECLWCFESLIFINFIS